MVRGQQLAAIAAQCGQHGAGLRAGGVQAGVLRPGAQLCRVALVRREEELVREPIASARPGRRSRPATGRQGLLQGMARTEINEPTCVVVPLVVTLSFSSPFFLLSCF